MKFLLPLALLALGATAQKTATKSDSGCDADYIVTNCLELEQSKIDNCDPVDYDCQCAAAIAAATCYNNCPEDPRASDAKSQQQIYCQNASLYGSSAKAKATRTDSASGSKSTAANNEAATTTEADAEASSTGSSTASAASNTQTNAAGEKVRGAGSVLLAVAGAVAAML